VPAPVPIGSPSQPSPASLPPDPEFLAKVDRFGYLDERYYANKHWLDERESLKKVIQEQYKDHPANQPVHTEGTEYMVDLTIRENQQKITDKAKAFRALRKAMGITPLIEALTYTLKLLDAHIPKQKQSFVVTERTGPRTLTSARKTAPKAA
jgi:hypothetical protein